MKYIVQLICVAFFVMMQGCAWITSSSPNAKTSGDTRNPKLSNLVGKNYIKGVVMALNHDTGAQMWNYVIEGVDTTNGKLPYVNFNTKVVTANEGDLVYASFNGNNLVEMLVIKPGYFKNGKTQPVVPKKSVASDKSAGKRDKAHQILAVPQEESIKLN